MQTTTFQLSGLTCTACTKLSANRIRKVPGISDVTVCLDTQIATVLSERLLRADEIKEALKETPYGVEE
ncbi:MAG: heavy metal-associated domain-containing protein [Candidatus Saccharibacteria bacterium]